MDWSGFILRAAFLAMLVYTVKQAQAASPSRTTVKIAAQSPGGHEFIDDPECLTDADCDDGLNCTIDTCNTDHQCT